MRLLDFKPLLLLSFGLAIASVFVPFLIVVIAFRASSDMIWAFQAEVLLAMAWLIVVAIGLVRFHARGLWMLLGAALVLWPVIVGLVRWI
jgi:hypothetical protein